MQSRWLLLPAASLSLFLSACTNGTGPLASNNPSGTGPFDSRGNYVEAWADNPSAWRKGNTQIVDAQPDRQAAEVPVKPEPVIAANIAPEPVSRTTTVVYKKPTPTPSTSVKPKPKPTTTVAKNTLKPKPVTKKTVAKTPTKPKSTRHTVKSGDNLYNIAKRYGTSVAAIQKANGTKGSMIRPGQALVIPR
jgi:LysM repeat protein